MAAPTDEDRAKGVKLIGLAKTIVAKEMEAKKLTKVKRMRLMVGLTEIYAYGNGDLHVRRVYQSNRVVWHAEDDEIAHWAYDGHTEFCDEALANLRAELVLDGLADIK